MDSKTPKKWEMLPIRMITGWEAKWCALFAVLDEQRKIVEFNDSEDIVWFKHNRMPWHIDAGCYGNNDPVYRVVFLIGDLESEEVDWKEHIVASRIMKDPEEMIRCIEEWMSIPPIPLD